MDMIEEKLTETEAPTLDEKEAKRDEKMMTEFNAMMSLCQDLAASAAKDNFNDMDQLLSNLRQNITFYLISRSETQSTNSNVIYKQRAEQKATAQEILNILFAINNQRMKNDNDN